MPYLLRCDDLAVSVLYALLLSHRVVELRTSDDGVASKHAHSVNLGVFVVLGGALSPSDEELTDLNEVDEERGGHTFPCMDSTPIPFTIF